MIDPLIMPTTRESLASIAQAICAIWETDVDTPAVYAEQCRTHQADLTHSVMAHLPDGQLVGIGVLCRRGTQGFVLDFGITPDFRGKGHGHRLFEALMAQARQAGLQEVSLLVAANNEAAIRIYRVAGFQHTRELVTLRGNMAAYAPGSAEEVRSDLPVSILSWFGGGRSVRPAWERDLPSLLTLSGARAFENHRGFLLARRSPYFEQVDIAHMGLDPDAQVEDVNALLYAASVAIDSDLPLALADEPVNSRAHRKLYRLGFRVVERTFEMSRRL